jgi:tripeptidyl-peptidase I
VAAQAEHMALKERGNFQIEKKKLLLAMKVLILLIVFVGIACARHHAQIRFELHPYIRVAESVDRSQVLETRVYLKQRNLDELEQLVRAVSTPSSADYGKHWSMQQIHERFSPSQESVDAVRNFFMSENVATNDDDFVVPIGRDFVAVQLSVADIERLFSTRLAHFDFNVAGGRRVLRSVDGYTAPAHICHHVDFVDGLVGFPRANSVSAASERRRDATTLEQATPDFLFKQYNITPPTGPTPGNSIANVQFGANTYSPQDLQTFFERYAPNLSGQHVSAIFGSRADMPTSIESNLDIQQQMGLAQYVNASIYQVPESRGILDDFLQWATYVNNQRDAPLVHSISYGQYGGKYDNVTVQRFDAELQKFGARGISVLLASGDNGVGCSSRCGEFLFDAPSSPHMLMVGATQFENDGEETGATLSSGGFSEDYWQPSWQAATVRGYLTNSRVKLPPSSDYFADGRAYPDVAAVGQDVIIVQDGRSTPIAGTSCSAPVTSAIVAILNGERLRAGKSPLGWLNPLFYAHADTPGAFKGISKGNNKKCRLTCCCEGFDAAPDGSWSPITGLGVVNYPVWSQLLSQTP